MTNGKHRKILDFLNDKPALSSKKIHEGLQIEMGYATVKRVLAQLVSENLLDIIGKGRGTKYQIGPGYKLFYPLNLDTYFEKEVDKRNVIESFNLKLINDILTKVNLFTDLELTKLESLQQKYTSNISELSVNAYNKELERLAIDLSWKSSQMEGNTYSLLETERLLKEKETAQGKAKDEAIMLLNHKDALDFIIENPTYIDPLTVSRIEDIHSILIKELGVDRNIRKRRVGITGTNYKPLDNEFQIKEALNDMCSLIEKRENVFEKALLALSLL